jgi:hypothetical protein
LLFLVCEKYAVCFTLFLLKTAFVIFSSMKEANFGCAKGITRHDRTKEHEKLLLQRENVPKNGGGAQKCRTKSFCTKR